MIVFVVHSARTWATIALILLIFSKADSAPSASSAPYRCNNVTEYRCSNSKCIPLSKVNDLVNDCGDNSDEVRHPCRAPMYSCRNDRCVLMEWVLDGTNDCIDMSDEVKLIGSPCHMALNCCFCDEFVANSECHRGFCRCSAGYYRNELGTECIRRIIGSQCSSHFDCRDTITDSSCILVDVDSNLAAPTSPSTPASSSRRRCTCNEGFTVSANSTRCDDYSTPRDVIIIAASVFIIGLLAVVNGFLIVWLCTAYVFRGRYGDSGAAVGGFRSADRRPPPSNFRQLVHVLRSNNRSHYRREYWVTNGDADRKGKRHENGNR